MKSKRRKHMVQPIHTKITWHSWYPLLNYTNLLKNSILSNMKGLDLGAFQMSSPSGLLVMNFHRAGAGAGSMTRLSFR